MQLNGTHTTGSRSFAVTLDQLELKEGRQVGRGQLYVVSHTKKNGEPVDKYSGDKIAEINNKYEANPSLANEEVHDGDVYSGLFPKERNGTWRGLGLLVGGSNSRNLAEIKAELQDTRNENSKLWSMVETLMKNQSDLQQQHNELKQMWLASQDHKSSDSCQKNEEQPKEPMEDMKVPEDHVKVASVLSRNVKISKAQAKVSFDTDNHEKATSLSSRNSKRFEVFNESEQEAVSPQQLSMKRQIAQPKEKTPPRVLRQKTKVSATNQSLHKKSRKFQTPLQKDDVREIITRGIEVGLVTSQSDIMVALATVVSTSYKSRPADGKIHHDCVEVLVNSVFNKIIGLPYPEGKIILLSSAIGHCIPWPRNDLVPISVKVRIMYNVYKLLFFIFADKISIGFKPLFVKALEAC
ncbi:hypothetical protein EJB05_29669 [Eragrostis curvula]|uniref:Transposase Tnp1/En/Spm-like domain-containing protein n=1 Tax=Eragrostis curvula TaxID=38414 RepID=A0A5J9UVN5_9POAL|nr:hypothetical protein EJB05_29669 [Eragrostis curvula]